MTIDQGGTVAPEAPAAPEPVAGAEPAVNPTVQDATTATPTGVYYCDQCGARYDGPGQCANQHAPTELVELAPDAEHEDGQDAAPIADGGDGTSKPADVQTEQPTPAAQPEPPTTVSVSQSLSVTIGDATYAGTIGGELTRI